MTSLENDFVKNHAREMQTHHWWIGLNYQVVEGHFIWDDDDTEATFTALVVLTQTAYSDNKVSCFPTRLGHQQASRRWRRLRCSRLSGWLYVGRFPLHYAAVSSLQSTVMLENTRRRRDYRVAAS
ncbi:hypothetical protein DPMN_072297 [Dreissena polymorpha]|uniref:C-type lectin domain-containing protein n=2 Tax=Dreissena polymorpha TaxID=45954 RepID=A0A9D4BQC2_DREPO|nr:hypothetical protein DPMN_072297 [Dreissena polymorpha]